MRPRVLRILEGHNDEEASGHLNIQSLEKLDANCVINDMRHQWEKHIVTIVNHEQKLWEYDDTWGVMNMLSEDMVNKPWEEVP